MSFIITELIFPVPSLSKNSDLIDRVDLKRSSLISFSTSLQDLIMSILPMYKSALLIIPKDVMANPIRTIKSFVVPFSRASMPFFTKIGVIAEKNAEHIVATIPFM